MAPDQSGQLADLVESPREPWRVWDRADEYGDVLEKRARGDLPEMDSARATAKRIVELARPHDAILDVGCGPGHYLRSLRASLKIPFAYTGVDATPSYIGRAVRVWPDGQGIRFLVGDVFGLPFEDDSFDIVYCCNVLLHMPSVAAPLRELVRVARREVLVRTLVGERSFLIKEVRGDGQLSEQGESDDFNYYNIYSRAYLHRILSALPRVARVEFMPDHDFSADRIREDAERINAANTTNIMGGWQVNGYVLQPWQFIRITKSR